MILGRSWPPGAAGLMLLAILGCEAPVQTVELVLGSGVVPGQPAPRGLDCIDQRGRLMACRVFDSEPQRLSVVVDVIPLGGLPRCRPNTLVAWCSEPTHDCLPDLRQRAIFEVQAPAERNLLLAVEQMREELSGQALPNPTVDEPVIVRATFLARDRQSILDHGDDFECDALVGCVYSCPVVLGAIDGELPLELDAFNSRCMAEVHQCASNPMFGIQSDCPGVSANESMADPLCDDAP